MMPEGPEVKHLSASIDSVIGGGRYVLTDAKITSGRYFDGARPVGWDELQSLLPLKIERCSSRGKFMYFRFDGGSSLWSTLGLTGWWSVDPSRPHTRAVLTAKRADPDDNGQLREIPLAFADVRNFGTLRFTTSEAELGAKLASLGLAWLDGEECGWEPFFDLVSRAAARYPQRPLAVFLMDQSRTAGIGNYILSEALYRAKIDPFISCGELDQARWRALHGAVSEVMRESFAAQGRGWRERFVLQVYQRKLDPEGRVVVRSVGPHKRAIWYVPEVQCRVRAAAAAATTVTVGLGSEVAITVGPGQGEGEGPGRGPLGVGPSVEAVGESERDAERDRT